MGETVFREFRQQISLKASTWIFALIRLCLCRWQPTPVFLPGESHGQRSLVGSRPESRELQSQTRPKRLNPESAHSVAPASSLPLAAHVLLHRCDEPPRSPLVQAFTRQSLRRSFAASFLFSSTGVSELNLSSQVLTLFVTPSLSEDDPSSSFLKKREYFQ